MATLGLYKPTHCRTYPSLRCIKQLRALFFSWMRCLVTRNSPEMEGEKKLTAMKEQMQINQRKLVDHRNVSGLIAGVTGQM